jgi:hypothetical protein
MGAAWAIDDRVDAVAENEPMGEILSIVDIANDIASVIESLGG